MERELNLPAASSTDTHLSRLSTSTSSSSSSSSSSFSSSSPPDFLRHVQAAFKRHRLLGTMQSNSIRPRRVLLPQREPLKNSTCDAEESEIDNNVDSEKKVQFLTGESENPQRVDLGMAIRSDFLSSHLGSLSLTEMESVANTNPEQKQHNEMSEGGISSLLAKRSQFPAFLGKDTNHPMTQSSVVGSSCMTTTSVHSKSAPMLNVATCSSRPPLQDSPSNMEIEPMEAFNVNPRPMTQDGPVQSSCPTVRNSSAAHTQSSICSLENAVGVMNNGLSKGQNVFASKEINKIGEGFVDHAKGSSHVEEKLNKSEGYDVIDVQSQAPLTTNSSTNVKVEPSKSDKLEKAASGKATSGSRKKSYDPDLFFKVNGKLYQKLGKIGSGGSSEVYKVISSDCTIYALKKIKLKGRDYSTAYGFCQEIEYLNKLKGKDNIIQLIDYEVTDKVLLKEVISGFMSIKDGRIKDDQYIYVVLEYGEIDLAHMLSQKWREMDSADWSIDENWLRFYWQQILQAVNTIHEERIVHSDLKPANFLLVRGSLKLIDFGIAKAIMSDTTNIQRDSQVGTLSYMSPEAFMCNEHDANGNTIKCGRPSDIWSLGCILYQMVYGRTPFSEYQTFWAKFKVVTDRNYEIKYEPVSNPWLLDLMKKCLAWERSERWRIPQLLQHPFLVPPVTTSSQLLQDEGCKLFHHIAEAYVNDNGVSRLCSQLHQLLSGSSLLIKSHPSIARDQHCALLSQVSRLCSQLQQHIVDTEK